MSIPYALAVHGGAGTIPRASLSAERERDFHLALRQVLQRGESVLSDGGSALDAVTEAVGALEDNPLFNAGRGAVFNAAGRHEMDAAVMEGASRRAGSVAGIFGPRNPVRLAHAVMAHTEHVLLVGDGALELARQQALPFEAPEYFFTEARWQSLQTTLSMRVQGETNDDPARRHGTVGAVARDRNGDVAAATSTGGMTAKHPGRVGDTPLVGAGTFANNATCAVSATGDGEIFMRWCATHEIDARMRLAGQSLQDAAAGVVAELAQHGGSGGVIAVDHAGHIAMPFNCEGMYRASLVEGGEPFTGIFA
jgi:beta-aspartyl-peptidase (threonine type)